MTSPLAKPEEAAPVVPSTGVTAALTCAALFAFAANSLLNRAALAASRIDATSFTSVRILSGALALALLVRRSRASGWLKSGSFISASALFAYAIAFSLGYVRIGAGIGSLVVFGTVQVTMVGWGLRRGERPRAGEWLGIVMALLGLSVFTVPGAHAPDLVGMALMVVAGAAWGVYSLRGRGSARPLAVTAANFARAVPFAIAASFLAHNDVHLTAGGIALAVASGAIASGVGYALWYAALRGHTATRAALVQLSVPVIATAGGVALLGEKITSRFLVGGGIVVAGVALAVSFQSSRVAPRTKERAK